MTQDNGSPKIMNHVGNTSSETIFEILRVLSTSERPLGLADLHRIVGEPTSSVHRAVATLEEANMAERYQSSARFVPGRMCSHLVRAVVNRYAVRATARQYLMRLGDLVDGPVTLNARLGWYSIRLAALGGRAEYDEERRIGQTRLLHLDASPLTILSFMREQERDDYIRFAEAQTGLPAYQLAVDDLIREVRHGDHVRRVDSLQSDHVWIGYPLFDPEGRVIAAIAASAPERADAISRDGKLFREISATVASLQRELSADPTKSAAPYGRIDPDSIVLGGFEESKR